MKRRTIRILSIDDDHGCQRAAAQFLTLVGGHQVEVAYNGGDGIKKALEIRPDAILLDLVMPDMDGGQVLVALYNECSTRDIPVFMLTGADLEASARSALYLNKNLKSIDQKPASFQELMLRIESAVSTRTYPMQAALPE
ncbi:MAG TPA: two-component system response regulator [Elusimicrobia bacterium]|nr:two-component system response regulator [Elusimicrobiota bacterium]